MTREEAHALVDKIFNEVENPSVAFAASPANEITEVRRVLPEDQRVVRTKTSGDKVYLLDENKKTRQWITNGEVLAGLGFEMNDVTEVDDATMMRYNMGPALYRAPESTSGQTA